VLICSSVTIVLALESAKVNKAGMAKVWMALTLILGGVFLGVKAYEYNAKFSHGIYPAFRAVASTSAPISISGRRRGSACSRSSSLGENAGRSADGRTGRSIGASQANEGRFFLHEPCYAAADGDDIMPRRRSKGAHERREHVETLSETHPWVQLPCPTPDMKEWNMCAS